jgi:hypothetical protein
MHVMCDTSSITIDLSMHAPPPPVASSRSGTCTTWRSCPRSARACWSAT